MAKKVLLNIILTSFKCEGIIFGEDFNLVLDVLKDKKGGKPTTHQNSLKMVQTFQNMKAHWAF